MSYVIYVDEMLGWNAIINIAVLAIASAILKVKFKLKRIIMYSLITSVITTLEYIFTLGSNKYIHHITYAGIYIIMIGMYFKRKSIGYVLRTGIGIFTSMFLLYGGIGLIFPRYIPSKQGGITTILIIFITYFVISSRLIFSTKENLFQLDMKIGNKDVHTKGFVDTGNTLHDPFTGMPVIILDYRIFKKILSPSGYKRIINYNLTGEFDYLYFKNQCEMDFYPIPYKTISTNFALMPVTKINSLVFTDFNFEIEKIVCGISRFKLKNNNEYQVLLSENLKPNRKEKFK